MSDQRIVWMDLEMTGLDPDTNDILEIATIVTDGQLEILAEGPNLIIHQPESRLAAMDDWNREHHKKSGLWQAAVESTITCAEAERETLAFIKTHVEEKDAPLAGNSVWQDRRFLHRHMKSINEYLHYRIIDVSTIKELARRWYLDIPPYAKKKSKHRALDDIRESIAELIYFRQKIFLNKE